MNRKNNDVQIDKGKVITIAVLQLFTLAIMSLGAFFSFFSLFNNISLRVLQADVPGVVFGILVFYLGLRYYLSVIKFSEEIYKETTKFSWSNFNKVKKNNMIS